MNMEENKTPAFQPDSELDMFADMLRRAVADCGAARWQPAWTQLAELGALSAVMPEERGGYGGARTLALVSCVLGEAGIVSPFGVSCAALARGLAEIGAPQVEVLLEAIGLGRLVAALALHEEDGLPKFNGFTSHLRKSGSGFRLTASKRMIPFGAEADRIILPARGDDGETVLVIIDRESIAGSMTSRVLIDGSSAVDLGLEDLELSEEAIMAQGAGAQRALEKMYDALAVSLLAEAVGAMRAMIDMTRSYLGVRRQFGAPLSVNQALRHRFVDMEIMFAKAKTMSDAAATMLESSDDEARRKMVAEARYIIGQCGRKVSQEAIQMHGAIGMAEENPLGRYFKRILSLSLWLGDEDDALRALCH